MPQEGEGYGATAGVKKSPLLLGDQAVDAVQHDFFAESSLPVQFAVPPDPHPALAIDQIHARPHPIGPSLPVVASGVEGDGVLDLVLGDFLAQVVGAALAFGFGR